MLSVSVPPSSLKLEVRPDVLRAGSQALLTCESRPSYPAAELTWWRDNVQVTGGVTALETFKAGSKGGYVLMKFPTFRKLYRCRRV